MAHKAIEEAVEALLEPILDADGIELVDVEYVRERNWILRIFIDKEGGVDLADCQSISEKAGEILDEKDIIQDNYMLAPLEEAGGGKAFTAHLEGLTEEGDLALTLDGGKEIALHRDKISQVRLHFSF